MVMMMTNPLLNEPVTNAPRLMASLVVWCVCGRYGAYICDQTEADVCSIECKHANLQLRQSTATDAGVGTGTGAGGTASGAVVTAHLPLSARQDHTPKSWGYVPHPTVASLTAAEVAALRAKHVIKVYGEACPSPILTFGQLRIHTTVARRMQEKGMTTPTAAQMQMCPAVWTGRDVVATAPPGTGKTLGFLLPALHRCVHHSIEGRGPLCGHATALVLEPFRELALQVEAQAKAIIRGVPGMKTAGLVGGTPAPPQVYRLRQGVQFVVATPGRLIDLLKEPTTGFFDDVKVIVIDEVDALLVAGFEEQVTTILRALPQDAQRVLVSATIPPSTHKLVRELVRRPIGVQVGDPSLLRSGIRHDVRWVPTDRRKDELFRHIADAAAFKPPLVVFVNSKIGAELLAGAVCTVTATTARCVQGNMEQRERMSVLAAFIEGQFPVLVATGIAGRGLDLVDVTQVVNFDPPATIDEYVHRAGRAGRRGCGGECITFVGKGDGKRMLADLAQLLSRTGSKCPPELARFAKERALSGASGRTTAKRRRRAGHGT